MEGLGGVARLADDGRQVYAFIVDQTVRVGIYSRSAELTRAMYVVLRAAMEIAIPALLELGYLNVFFASAEDLTPEEALIAEEMGIYVRRQSWSAQSQVEAIEPASAIPSPKTWTIQVEDIEVDGTPGGVVPLT